MQQSSKIDPGKGTGTGSLVLGILSLVLLLFTSWNGLSFISIILSIIGLILGIVSGNKSSKAGFSRSGAAIGGIVCSIIGCGLGVLTFMACASCVGAVGCAGCTEAAFDSYYYICTL